MSKSQPRPEPSDGAEASLSIARSQTTYEARFNALRLAFKNKPMACHDCRSLRDGFVMLLDGLIASSGVDAPVEVEIQPVPDGATESYANASVRMIPGNPSDVQRGREVTPGVVMIPPDADPLPTP